MPRISRLEVISTGARRRWTLEEKQRIVAESFAGSRLVSATARRHGLSTGQLFTWRRLARSGRLVEDAPATFAQAVVTSEPSTSAPLTPPEGHTPAGQGRMEIIIPNGRRVVVGPDVDRVALTRILDVLERRP
jgi:transposase